MIRKRVGVYVVVEANDAEQMRRIVERFAKATGKAIAEEFRRSDTPTLYVEDEP